MEQERESGSAVVWIMPLYLVDGDKADQDYSVGYHSTRVRTD